MRKILLLSTLLFLSTSVLAQDSETPVEPKVDNSGFKEYYPISSKPSLGYMSSMYSSEDILFDAKPTVYYSIYNNMRERMQTTANKGSNAFYASFQPHIRMYNENSKPVKTPSYRIILGWQHLIKTPNNNFFAIAVESGHFSNGQSGCAFDGTLDDETMECEMVYRTITDATDLSAMLNRKNGNFSTNLSRVAANFRFNNLSRNDKPYKVHSITATYELFHNNMFGIADVGGYSDDDIEIYGRNRFGLEYEYIHTYMERFRYSVGQKLELIQGSHDSVEPIRIETSFTWYPFATDLGVYASYIYGHDNYNYRFVDTGSQISIGITWDWFTPFQIKRAEKIRSLETEI